MLSSSPLCVVLVDSSAKVVGRNSPMTFGRIELVLNLSRMNFLASSTDIEPSSGVKLSTQSAT